jgi:hypothetical protein
MSDTLGAVCDEFYVSSRLFLKLQMNLERETVLHFFDRIRREYPNLRKLRHRDNGSLLLEEDPDENGSRRWVRLDPDSLRLGHVVPPDLSDVRRFSSLVMSQAPFHLTFSDIDYDHLELIYGFDLEFRGNHDQIVAETLFGEGSTMGQLLDRFGGQVIDAQPYFGVALNESCDLQAYVEIKSRTTTYEIRTGQYDAQPLSIFLTIRKYWGMDIPESPEVVLRELYDAADEFATEHVVPEFVNPLAAAIANRL